MYLYVGHEGHYYMYRINYDNNDDSICNLLCLYTLI